MRRILLLTTILTLGSATVACEDDEYKWHFEPECGNGAVDEGEACDAPSLGGATCVSLGFTGGLLECTLQCTYKTTGCTGGCEDICTEGVARCLSSADAIETCIVAENGCTAWITTACEAATPFCVTLDGSPLCHESACAPICTLGQRRCHADGTTRQLCQEDGEGCPEWDSLPCPEELPVCELIDDVFSCNAM
jgi:hypothetical protein